jgi:hypothetical protein
MNVSEGTHGHDMSHDNDVPRDHDRTHTRSGRSGDHGRLPDTDGYGHG